MSEFENNKEESHDDFLDRKEDVSENKEESFSETKEESNMNETPFEEDVKEEAEKPRRGRPKKTEE